MLLFQDGFPRMSLMIACGGSEVGMVRDFRNNQSDGESEGSEVRGWKQARNRERERHGEPQQDGEIHG